MRRPNLLDEELITLTDVAAMFPPARRGKSTRNKSPRINTKTVWRWCDSGSSRPDGTRVILEFIRVGGRVLTSRQAVRRFIDALNNRPAGTPSSAPRSPAQRNRAGQAAGRRFEELGKR